MVVKHTERVSVLKFIGANEIGSIDHSSFCVCFFFWFLVLKLKEREQKLNQFDIVLCFEQQHHNNNNEWREIHGVRGNNIQMTLLFRLPDIVEPKKESASILNHIFSLFISFFFKYYIHFFFRWASRLHTY